MIQPVVLRKSKRKPFSDEQNNYEFWTAESQNENGFLEKNSRKPRGSELERGGYRTGNSSFPPQVDVIIVPFQTDQQDCSSLTDCCAVVKGRMPVGQLAGLEQALLRVLELAVLIR